MSLLDRMENQSGIIITDENDNVVLETQDKEVGDSNE
jgi:hypothetical protein